MRPAVFLTLCAATALPNCSLYNPALLEDAVGNDESGGGTSSGGLPQIGSGGFVPFAGGSDSGGTGSMTGSGADSMGGDPGSGGTGGGDGDGDGDGGCDVVPTETVDLVDDMRLAGNRILPRNGRTGAWLAFHGADMEVSPDPDPTGAWPDVPMSEIPGTSGDYALHYTAAKVGEDPDPAEIWQQFGFLLKDGEAYDLSSYDGILFCGLRVAPTPQSLSLRLTTYAEVLADEEQYETPGGIVSADWGIVKIPFDAEWPATALENAKNLEFIGANGVEYDIWIDNIALYND